MDDLLQNLASAGRPPFARTAMAGTAGVGLAEGAAFEQAFLGAVGGNGQRFDADLALPAGSGIDLPVIGAALQRPGQRAMDYPDGSTDSAPTLDPPTPISNTRPGRAASLASQGFQIDGFGRQMSTLPIPAQITAANALTMAPGTTLPDPGAPIGFFAETMAEGELPEVAEVATSWPARLGISATIAEPALPDLPEAGADGSLQGDAPFQIPATSGGLPVIAALPSTLTQGEGRADLPVITAPLPTILALALPGTASPLTGRQGEDRAALPPLSQPALMRPAASPGLPGNAPTAANPQRATSASAPLSMAEGPAMTDRARPQLLPSPVSRDQAALVPAGGGPMPAQGAAPRPSSPAPNPLHPADPDPDARTIPWPDAHSAPQPVTRATLRADALAGAPALPATPSDPISPAAPIMPPPAGQRAPDPSMRPVARPEMPAMPAGMPALPREPRVLQAAAPTAPDPRVTAMHCAPEPAQVPPTRPGSIPPAIGDIPLAAAQVSPARVAREEGSIRVTSATPDGSLRSGLRTGIAAGLSSPTRLSSAASASTAPNAALADPSPGLFEGADPGVGQTLHLPGTATAALTLMNASPPALLAQGAAHQVAVALSEPARDTRAPLELALDPPELGRVRLQITDLAGIMTLTIHAERPETAELMRRHLDLLAQEFAQAGLDAPQVRISQDGPNGGNAQSRARDEGPQSASPPAPEAQTVHQPSRTASGGLDLRL